MYLQKLFTLQNSPSSPPPPLTRAAATLDGFFHGHVLLLLSTPWKSVTWFLVCDTWSGLWFLWNSAWAGVSLGASQLCFIAKEVCCLWNTPTFYHILIYHHLAHGYSLLGSWKQDIVCWACLSWFLQHNRDGLTAFNFITPELKIKFKRPVSVAQQRENKWLKLYKLWCGSVNVALVCWASIDQLLRVA